MNVYEVAETGTLDEIKAALVGEEGVQELIDALDMNDRDELLAELVDDPVFGEEATQKISYRKWMKEAGEAWEAQCDAYPEVFKRWREVLLKSPKVGIFDVCYPCKQVQMKVSPEAAENTVAISGDGFYMFHFEILSLNGDGSFQLARHPTGMDDLGKPRREGRDSLAFRTGGGRNWQFGDILTGTQVLQGLTGIYG